jgi:hypothetical protein
LKLVKQNSVHIFPLFVIADKLVMWYMSLR